MAHFVQNGTKVFDVVAEDLLAAWKRLAVSNENIRPPSKLTPNHHRPSLSRTGLLPPFQVLAHARVDVRRVEQLNPLAFPPGHERCPASQPWRRSRIGIGEEMDGVERWDDSGSGVRNPRIV
jgi:hypothetical protein